MLYNLKDASAEACFQREHLSNYTKGREPDIRKRTAEPAFYE